MNDVIDRIYATGQVYDADGRAYPAFPTSIDRTEGQVLYDLARRCHARRTLEIGMAYGVATLFLCQAVHDNGGGTHVAIDPLESCDWRSIGMLNSERAGLKGMVNLIEQPSHIALPRLLAEGQRFDMVFVDGQHLFDYMLLDFFYADQLIDTGGFIVFDDLWLPSMKKLLAFVLRNRRYRIATEMMGASDPPWYRAARFLKHFVCHPLDGMYGSLPSVWSRLDCVVIQKLDKDERRFDHYRSF